MKRYKLNNKIVQRPKSLVLNGSTYVPPTDGQLIEAGYEIEEIEYTPKRVSETYKQKVERLIRKKYSVSDELAILRQRDTKPDEFSEYNSFCEECKRQAKGTE